MTVSESIQNFPRVLILDPSRMGSESATGQLLEKLFSGWPEGRLLQVYSSAAWGVRLYRSDQSFLLHLWDLFRMCDDFAPDVIYFRPLRHPVSFYQTALYLLHHLGRPYVVHLMDDWMARAEAEEPEVWPLFQNTLPGLLSSAHACLSICDAMSEAFEARYGRSFVAVANGVDDSKGDFPVPRSLRPEGERVVRYVGSLANDMARSSVRCVAQAVSDLSRERSLRMEVFAREAFEAVAAQDLLGLPGVQILGAYHQDYEQVLGGADVLLIAYNFDPASIRYTRYSFSNKLPECLHSGVPILAVGPEDCASIAFLKEHGGALVVDKEDPKRIADALIQLSENQTLRRRLVEQARFVVQRYFRLEVMRGRLREVMMSSPQSTPLETNLADGTGIAPEGWEHEAASDGELENSWVHWLLGEAGVTHCNLVTTSQPFRIVLSDFRLDWSDFSPVTSSERLPEGAEPEFEGVILSVASPNPQSVQKVMGSLQGAVPPGWVVIPFNDAEWDAHLLNFHWITTTLRRAGYQFWVSEWVPAEEGFAHRRIVSGHCLLTHPLSRGWVIGKRQ